MPGLLDLLSQTWPARMAQDAWSAVTLPRDVYQGKVDPLSADAIGRASNLAMLPMMGTFAGAPAGALGSGPVRQGIRAYHGSPYDFERFDMSKIGTGEGAQAYGHGLYFAEKEGVAREYRDKLSNLPMHGSSVKLDPDAGYIATRPDGSRQIFSFEKDANEWVQGPGKMYEVNINAHPEQFLDWEKPWAQQAPKVQSAARDILGDVEPMSSDAARGYDIYQQVINKALEKRADLVNQPPSIYRDDLMPKRQLASEALREAGIPGIKYLDQGSRTAGEGSRNYVLFRDDIIDIVKKYGWAGLAALTGIDAATLPASQQQQMAQ